MWARIRCLFLVAFLVFGFCQIASAELETVGPVDEVTGFPQRYQDGNGLALELCLPPGGNCLSDPIIFSNIFSRTIGFGEKAYYWSATAQLTGTGAKGNLEMALVASFSGSIISPVPFDGEQIVFFQFAVGPITGLTAGNVYRVTHPFGVIENLVADNTGTISRLGQDIGCATASTTVPCDFTGVLGSMLGPFLQWDPAAAPGPDVGFIGNPVTAHPVIGSPFNTNVFKIEGPNAAGAGLGIKQTNLFKVQGKKATGVPSPEIPLVIDRATYTRPLPPQIEVIARSSSALTASLVVSGAGILTTPMVKSGGKYFARIFSPPAFPNSITVTAREPGKTPVTVTTDLIDVVTITSAEFNPGTLRLTIEASSSDAVVPPVLNAVGFGNLTAGSLVVTGVTVPPAQVTVVSSLGGVATVPVSVIGRPIARNNAALTLRANPVVIDILGNDIVDGSGNSLDPSTVTVTAPSKGTITSIDPATGAVTYTSTLGPLTRASKDTFSYTVEDSFTQRSNAAAVTVNVVETETVTISRAIYRSGTKWWQISGKSTVRGLGNKVTIYLGPTASGTVIGAANVNTFGNWAFSKFPSPVDPGSETMISVKSALGTEVLAFLITFP